MASRLAARTPGEPGSIALMHPHVGSGLPGGGRDPRVIGVRVGQQDRADVAERVAGAFQIRPELRKVPGQPAVDQHDAAGFVQEVEVDLYVTEPGDARAGRRLAVAGCEAVLGMASSR